ncbi:hypothetical protein ACH4E7_25195 [Kitasatospora sp. NPDC018058]|uniref:hypothetical protein n=1 Tax=Kitasatospora sp. NPDC018058 TaxID=3364025 RepID=UPI0037C04593
MSRPFLADYRRHRDAMAAGAGKLGYLFGQPTTGEDRVKETLEAFVGELAGVSGLVRKAVAAAEAGRLPRAV